MDNDELDFYEQLDKCREKLLILKNANEIELLDSNDIPLRVAQYFIKNCAYWDHPTGRWVQAPKHSERIKNGGFGYELCFGGNYFLVGLAVARCVNTVTDLLDKLEQKYMDDFSDFDYEELLSDLFLNVRGAVANVDGHEYKGYYPIDGHDMIFGTQAISVRQFVGIVTATTEISKMSKY